VRETVEKAKEGMQVARENRSERFARVEISARES